MTAVCLADTKIISDHIGVSGHWAFYFQQFYQVESLAISMKIGGFMIPEIDHLTH